MRLTSLAPADLNEAQRHAEIRRPTRRQRWFIAVAANVVRGSLAQSSLPRHTATKGGLASFAA